MTEEFLHYIWKHRLFDNDNLFSQNGERVEVLQQGEPNTNAGPDFFNAKIRINNTLWAGNAEIHINSSDWAKHNHQTDKSYDNVILQAVFKNDAPVKRSNGEFIPTIELKFDQKLLNNYETLLQNQLWVPCQNEMKRVDSFLFGFWLNNLTIERLEKKSELIIQTLSQNNNNWEEAFYQHLMRNFGFKVNAEPFEMLAKFTPLNILAKHKNSLFQLEAMLFGQAGMLVEPILQDDYYSALQKEYLFLRKKFNLKPVEKHLWKFLRLRPVNFPTIRIAQFATLVHQSNAMFSRILESQSVNEVALMFNSGASSYWDVHYNFGKISKLKKKTLGEDMIHSILINTIIPFLFVYGKQKDNQVFKDKAVAFLEALPSENNSIIKQWKSLDIKVKTAFDTQALLQLKNEYCNRKRCLYCHVGGKIISL
jgi:hypothetical protein